MTVLLLEAPTSGRITKSNAPDMSLYITQSDAQTHARAHTQGRMCFSRNTAVTHCLYEQKPSRSLSSVGGARVYRGRIQSLVWRRRLETPCWDNSAGFGFSASQVPGRWTETGRGGGYGGREGGREAADGIVRGRVCVLIGSDGGLVTGAALLSLYTASSFDLLPVLTVLPPNKNTPHKRTY